MDSESPLYCKRPYEKADDHEWYLADWPVCRALLDWFHRHQLETPFPTQAPTHHKNAWLASTIQALNQAQPWTEFGLGMRAVNWGSYKY
jgi:hypothetical protein